MLVLAINFGMQCCNLYFPDIEGIINSILSLMFVIPVDKGQELIVLLCDKLKIGLECGKSLVSLKS